MTKTILIVAAHLDDEALGCGGTITRHVAEGDIVHAVFMADGVTSRPNASQISIGDRIQAARQAHKILGISEQRVAYLNLPDNRMDSLPFLDIVQKLEPIIESIKPQSIYTHHYGDLNIDHHITHQAVLTACRPVPDSSVCEIFGFEVLSSTEWAHSTSNKFEPSLFVDIGEYLNAKLKALEAYQVEMRAAPHSRSLEHVESLARHRGYSVGVHAAEAFTIIRLVR